MSDVRHITSALGKNKGVALDERNKYPRIGISFHCISLHDGQADNVYFYSCVYEIYHLAICVNCHLAFKPGLIAILSRISVIGVFHS